MNCFHLKILAAERVFFDGACRSLVVPTLDGLYGIQAQHENVVIAVVPGTLSLRSAEGEEIVAAVSGGVLKMENNEALLLVDTAERPEEIDLSRAERDAAEAKEALLQKRSAQESHLAEERMARALNRIKTKKYKR
ncbi:MAG: ATP synthase F1 subunit epsilon [Eubacteriales bacterium]|nr:ATP synthase F1 subunit epsilon [Eubacteriales bacterium]